MKLSKKSLVALKNFCDKASSMENHVKEATKLNGKFEELVDDTPTAELNFSEVDYDELEDELADGAETAEEVVDAADGVVEALAEDEEADVKIMSFAKHIRRCFSELEDEFKKAAEEVNDAKLAAKQPINPIESAAPKSEDDVDEDKMSKVESAAPKGKKVKPTADTNKVVSVSANFAKALTNSFTKRIANFAEILDEGKSVVDQVSEMITDPVVEQVPVVDQVCDKCGKVVCVCEGPVSKLAEVAITAFSTEAIKDEIEEAAEVIGDEEANKMADTLVQFSKMSRRSKVRARCFAADEVANAKQEIANAIDSEGKVDMEAISIAAETLEKNAPGVGDIIVKVTENFSEIIEKLKSDADAIEPQDMIVDPDKIKDLSEEITAKVENFSDKSLARKIKTKLFAVEAAVEDLATSGATDVDVVTAADELADELIETEEDFSEAAKIMQRMFFSEAEDDLDVPAEVAEQDKKLNDIVDGLELAEDEQANLDPTAVSFAKKLLNSIKAVKCFSHSDIVSKYSMIKEFGEELYKAVGKIEEIEPAGAPPTEVPEDKKPTESDEVAGAKEVPPATDEVTKAAESTAPESDPETPPTPPAAPEMDPAPTADPESDKAPVDDRTTIINTDMIKSNADELTKAMVNIPASKEPTPVAEDVEEKVEETKVEKPDLESAKLRNFSTKTVKNNKSADLFVRSFLHI